MDAKKLRTHYDNLKVARDAPPEVIRAAYRALAQRHHPDRNPGNERAAKVMAIVNASYAVLSDPATRKAHDEWIASQEGYDYDIDGQSEDAPIRAEPRKVEQPTATTPRFNWAPVSNWVRARIGGLVLALVVPLLIGGLFRMPSMISKVSKANAISSSARERAREDCNAELALLRMFTLTAINPESERVPADIRANFVAAVLGKQHLFNADTTHAVFLVWEQREDLREWKLVKLAQTLDACVEKRVQMNSHSLTDWFPLAQAGR